MSAPARPTVFVSYSHDSPAHEERVLELANRLRGDGIEAWIDQYVPAPPEGWPAWVRRQVVDCDFVLLVCTARFRALFDREERSAHGSSEAPMDDRRDVEWGALIGMQLVYEAGARNERLIPILLADGAVENVPLFLRPYTRYRLPQEHERLYRRLTGQPEIAVPSLGVLRTLAPRAVAVDDGGAGVGSVRTRQASSEIVQITEDALVNELARVIWEPDEARLVAQRAGFDRGRIPAFRTAMVFWSRMIDEARHGAIAGGLAAVAKAAARQYPENAVFGAFRSG